jgi:nitrite reductase/ring-hydroxylating ferredoxin subunit
MSERYPVCPASELLPGQRKIISAGKLSIGVFNIDGKFHALRNLCPHQLAPLCQGKLTGTSPHGAVGEYQWEREGQIIRCPWHGWEFDVRDGKSVFNPHKLKVRTYEVTVENSDGSNCPKQLNASDEDPAVSTYPVSHDNGMIYVHF